MNQTKVAVFASALACAVVEATRYPPIGKQQESVILELRNTFPARLGSFYYELFSCDQYYLYTYVSIEDSGSRPLTRGLRGLFIEDPVTGNLDGWVINASNWSTKSVFIRADDFNPSRAPDFLSI